MTPTQKLVAEWQASRPAFTGKVTRQSLDTTKAERRAAKSKLVKKASKV